MQRVILGLLMLVTASAAQASEQDAFSVRLLGVKVGEMRMAWEETAQSYSVAARFKTTGLAGALSTVYFNVTAQGRRSDGRYLPQRYTEQMDTGERVADGSMVWRNGLPRPEGERFDNPDRVPAARIRGAVDPMTALFMVAKDRDPAGLCDVAQTIYDGERLTQIVFDGEKRKKDRVTCTGRYERLAGYSKEDLRNNAIFPISVTYTPAGARMEMYEVRVKTIYGDATILRMN